MYQSLYRKYRPKCFNDVVGQDVVVTTLKNSILNDKIGHAYMFIGSRGIGKTSIAKIFARAVNCSNSKDGDICNQCPSCKITSGKECLDIIEIDAASNNGVDEIRNLRDKVKLVPSNLKYKIYIIDEVHMLTIQAFNALLKTLEEPPKHVIFILATTDPQKVPETIISRCQCFNFNRISEKNIVLRLRKICESENIDIDDEVLENIAYFADGGMRDSIGMLDKLNSYSNSKIHINDFIKLNGLVSNNDIDILIQLISKKDILGVIELIDKWNNMGVNIVQILNQILRYFRIKIIDYYKKNDNINFDINIMIDLINNINEKMLEIRKSNNPSIYFEILLLKFIDEYSKKNISREIIPIKKDKKIMLDKEEKKVNYENENKDENKNDNVEIKTNIDDIIKVRVNNTMCDADKSELVKNRNDFKKLNDFTFDQKIGYLVCTLLDGDMRASGKNSLILSYEYDSVVKENKKNVELLEKTMREITGINKKIAIVSNSEWENIKNEYISKIKKGEKYIYIDEPELVYLNQKSVKKSINNGILDTFGDIVEIEN